jgi:N-acetylmuramoyl-L-alanine amidase
MIYLALIEGGHGRETSGKESPYIAELGRRIKENEFNDSAVAILKSELERHGVHVYDVAPGHTDVPLKTRTSEANRIYKEYQTKHGAANVKAIYISIHFNALDGTFDGANPEGFSVHIYPGHRGKDSGRLAQYVLDELKNGTKQVNRGIVEQDLHVVRVSNMPAILTENGFMDNPREARLMLNTNFQEEVGVEHAKGALKYFGIAYKTSAAPINQPGDATIHKVVSGDTLWGIASKYRTTVNVIRIANNLKNDNIYPGQTLKVTSGSIPVSQPAFHIVRSGDTISEIAVKYKVSQTQLKAWNGLNNNYTIYIGQKLRVK